MKRKFKLKGEQLYKKHAISVIMQAMHCQAAGNFIGKGLQLRWVTLQEQLTGPYNVVNTKTGERVDRKNFDPTLTTLKHYQDESKKHAQTLPA